jgi:hypothetical protein
METIEGTKNIIVTECGHRFHCNCLMQNAAHNGFGCPYCRTVMAEEPVEDDEDEDDVSLFDYEDTPELLTDNELTSFRMFNQLLEGEVVEQEPEDEPEEEPEDDELEEELPDAQYMAQKLNEKGITYEDLIKCLLWGEHSDLGTRYEKYERRSNEVYGQIKKASRRFVRQNESRQPETRQPETVQVQYESGRIETLQFPQAVGITLSENVQSVLIEDNRTVDRNIQMVGRRLTNNEA